MNHRISVPVELYALVERTPATVLLDSGNRTCSQTNKKLFMAPVRVCAAWQPAEIPALFAEIEIAVAAGMSAAGFFSYECGACFEPKAALHASRRPNRKSPQPLAWFGIYERAYVFDVATGEFIDGAPPELDSFHGPSADPGEEAASIPEIAAEFALNEVEYAQRIAAIHELIRAGDVYQLNFTAPFHFKVKGSAAALYARLRARQPVNYGGFLHWEQGRFIQSFSPELFFRIDHDGPDRRIVTRPMKGTAPRGRTTSEDREIAEWLRNDAKNRSENVMIVDLLRNDLGRIAKTGSVRAESLFDVERHPTLWQMTSTVSAELRPDVDFSEIFRALFPSGSVTGAPKVRAMQLLAELEESPRGVYTGAIGFFSPRETVFNVAIRTLEIEDGRAIMGAGSGIVIDSDPSAEYRECLLKAAFLTGPLHRPAGTSTSHSDKLFLIETMLWDPACPLGKFPFLGLHLDRLADSADYFGFACGCEAIRAALEEHSQQFAGSAARKVRLLLIDPDGSFRIGSEPLLEPGTREQVARACIAPVRTDAADPMLYHKTTQRAIYALQHLQAAERGFDDVLFLNLRGEVTEGAISNIFVEKDGRWSTPPIECGLLPGVFRRHLLATRPEIEERVLTLDDLRNADAVYLTNAVRGLRRAMIEW